MPLRPPTLKDFGNELGIDLSAMVIPAAQVSGVVGGVVANQVTALNVKIDYGAVGDGVTNDTTAIQNAINAANAAGGGVVFFPAGTYFISTSLTHKSNVTLQGAGMGLSILKFSNTSAALMINGDGSNSSITTLTAQANIGTRVFACTTVVGLAVGDLVMAYTSAAGAVGGFVTRIGAISGNNVTMEEDSTHVFPTASSNIYKLTPTSRAAIRDLTIMSPTGNCQDSTVRKSGALSFQNAFECVVDSVEFRGIAGDTSTYGVRIGQARDCIMRNCRFDRCADSDPAPTQSTLTVVINQTTGMLFQGNSFRRSGGSGCVIFQGTGHSVCNGNHIGGMTNWIGYVADGTTPLSIDNGGRSIKWQDGNNFFVCADNIFHDGGFDGIHIDGSLNNSPNAFGTVTGNVINFAHDVALMVNTSNDIVVSNNIINRPSVGTGTYHGIYLSTAARCTVTGNQVSNVTLTGIRLATTVTDSIIANNIVNTTSDIGIEVITSCTRNVITGNVVRASVTNSIKTLSSSGGNAVYANIVDRAVSLHASDKKINDSAAADSNWVL